MATWKITTPSIYWSSTKEKEDKRRERLAKAAQRRRNIQGKAIRAADRRSRETDAQAKNVRALVEKIKELRERKFKWKEIDVLIQKQRSIDFYRRNKYLCEEGIVLREFTCAQCEKTISITNRFDKRRKFCSTVCEKRYWRHRKKKEAG